jgi:hypothetical protein
MYFRPVPVCAKELHATYIPNFDVAGLACKNQAVIG